MVRSEFRSAFVLIPVVGIKMLLTLEWVSSFKLTAVHFILHTDCTYPSTMDELYDCVNSGLLGGLVLQEFSNRITQLLAGNLCRLSADRVRGAVRLSRFMTG